MGESLYNISAELATINDELVDAGGEITDELERRLDALSIDFDNKVFSITKWSKNLEGKEEAIEKELARLQARKKATENLRERLKKYVKESMEKVGKTKVEFPTFTIAIQRNPDSIEIAQPDLIPAKYVTIKTERVIDKKGVLEDMKRGERVEGANLISDRTHLRIR